MNRNVGGLDRKARLVLGPLLLVVAAVSFIGFLAVSPVIAAIAFVVGAVLLVTGITQRCPANSILGVDTCKRN